MIVRLIPYSEIFVSVTMDLDEAVAVADVLATLRTKGKLQHQADELRTELEAALERAATLKKERADK